MISDWMLFNDYLVWIKSHQASYVAGKFQGFLVTPGKVWQSLFVKFERKVARISFQRAMGGVYLFFKCR